MSDRIDLEQPLRYEGDALVAVSRDRMYAQRIQRLALMDPNGLYHRPGIGGGMRKYQNKPPHPQLIQQQQNAFSRFLDALPFVEAHEVRTTVDRERNAVTRVLRARIDGSELVIRDVEI